MKLTGNLEPRNVPVVRGTVHRTEDMAKFGTNFGGNDSVRTNKMKIKLIVGGRITLWEVSSCGMSSSRFDTDVF